MMMLSGADELLLEAAAASLRNDVVIMHALVHALDLNLDTPPAATADLRLRVGLTIKLIDEIDAEVRVAMSAAADEPERKPPEPPVHGRHGDDGAGGSSEAKAEPSGGGATPATRC
jgi:hypothetical protein